METDEAADRSRSTSASPEDEGGAADEDEGLPEEPDSMPREVKGILVYHRGSEKRNKGISWKAETDLVSVRYFELDEDERVNVNKIKFENMREMELKMEKAAIKSKGAVGDDEEQAEMEWFLPPKVTVERKEPFEPGSNSLERELQQQRRRTSCRTSTSTRP